MNTKIFTLEQTIETLQNGQVFLIETQKDLTTIMQTKLDEITPSFQDYIDLQHVQHISQILFMKMSIIDLKILSRLQNIFYINLSNNQISDLSPLKGNLNLMKLDVSQNKISCIKALQNLVNLTYLNVSHNKVLKISALKNLKNLKTLNIQNTKVVDISVLKHLPNLIKLFITQDNSNFLEVLPKFKNISNLNLNQNISFDRYDYTSISPIQSVNNREQRLFFEEKQPPMETKRIYTQQQYVRYCIMYNMPVITLNQKPFNLSSLTFLRSLNVSNLNLQAIDFISCLVNLEQLNISQNRLTSIKPVQSLIKLQVLDFSFNLVTAICPLRFLTNLSHLSLIGNKISDLFPVAHLNLKTLYATLNNLMYVPPLNLEILELSQNFIQTNIQLQNLYMFDQQVPSHSIKEIGKRIQTIRTIQNALVIVHKNKLSFLNKNKYLKKKLQIQNDERKTVLSFQLKLLGVLIVQMTDGNEQ
ncbi:Internalin-A_precursor [Hexamita inflata]|uniref:Internalin-A n=1 Tax=Hexamita inflata TaxID=28002 RepID=A0AA86Q6Z1_9EUKA|nr:Internalin-A precursor [Hexamita inflata]